MRTVIFGGTSQIGLAIAKAITPSGGQIVLAARKDSKHLAAARAELNGWHVEVVDFDAAHFADHPGVVSHIFSRRVDQVIIAFGVLGDKSTWQRQNETLTLAQVNFTGALSVGCLVGQAMRAQAVIDGVRGRIIVLSSVAGERVRQSNFVYGATKRGMDAYFEQLGEALRDDAVSVLRVRPGVVATRMVAGRAPVPLTSTTTQVGKAVAKALKQSKTMIRVPWVFAPVMGVFKHLPAGLVRLFTRIKTG